MTIKVGINGFGRIGRLVMRAALERDNIQIVGINDLLDLDYIAYMFKYDSTHGRFDGSVEVVEGGLSVNGQFIRVTNERNPEALAWDAIDTDVVVEATGLFLTEETAAQHITAGAKKVVMSAPSKDHTPMFVMGVNHTEYTGQTIVSNASCTTNCLAPVVQVVHNSFGIKHGSITTLHDVTNTQVIVDGFHNDLRRARSCIQSVIPTTTGSAKAIGLIFPELEGKLNGHAVRIPLLNASLTDAVFELEKEVSVEDINGAFEAAANGELRGILGYETRPLVSVDYVNDKRSTIVDALSTMVINGTQVKIYAWYDNEWGYSSRMADLACHVVSLEE